MSTLTGYICLLLVSVFISSVSQILLKKAADRTYENHIREYLNPLVIFSYGMFFCSVILTMLALKKSRFPCSRFWNLQVTFLWL